MAAATGVQEWRRKVPAWQSFSMDFLLGGIIGGVSHTVVAPIERVKLILQTQESNAAMLGGHHRRFKGFFDTVFTITREEGFLALWRGNATGVLRYYPSVALNFAFKDYYRSLLRPVNHTPSPGRIAAGNFLAGAAAGATSLAFTYPLDLAHTRLATDVGARKERQFQGLRSVLLSTYRKDGLRGLYRGFPASVHGILIHRSVYFGGFDSAKQLLLKDDRDVLKGAAGGQKGVQRSSFWLRWLLAQTATSAASIVAYPFDTVRHRMMMQVGLAAAPTPLTGSGVNISQNKGGAADLAGASRAGHPSHSHPTNGNIYNSTWDCWRKIFLKEGPAGFYRGIFSNLLRGTGAAFVLVMYDEFKQLLHVYSV